MLIRCREVTQAGPAEAVVEIATRDGSEEVVIQRRFVKAGMLEVGNVLTRDGKFSLVELPRETTSGKWRIWVPQDEVTEAA